MSNLGGYQILTTIAKKVGGPGKLVLLIATGGAILFEGGKYAFKKGKKFVVKAKSKSNKIYKNSQIKYLIKKDGKSNEGLELKAGNYFSVLESDGDSVLIELIGNENNPYFVSKKLLKQISDYKESSGII